MEYPNKNMHQYYTDQGTPLGKVLHVQLLANFEKKKPLLEVTYYMYSNPKQRLRDFIPEHFYTVTKS